jgi:hypothetical protein
MHDTFISNIIKRKQYSKTHRYTKLARQSGHSIEMIIQIVEYTVSTVNRIDVNKKKQQK